MQHNDVQYNDGTLPEPPARRRPRILFEHRSKVFEATRSERLWSPGDPYEGLEVPRCGRLDELTKSFYFVVPRLVSPWSRNLRTMNLLTIARGRVGDRDELPSFWDPVKLKKEAGGIFAHVTWDLRQEVIDLRMNAGSSSRELVGVSLPGASPELLCGKVLESYAEINADRVYFAVHDRFSGGDVLLSGVAPSTGRRKCPWGGSHKGPWWIWSGLGNLWDRQRFSLPPGFGLSDLRITLAAENQYTLGSLPYKGALDHLAESRRGGRSRKAAKSAAPAPTLWRRPDGFLTRLRRELPLVPRPTATHPTMTHPTMTPLAPAACAA